MVSKEDDDKLVGADRVLAVLIALAEYPSGATLDEMAQRVGASKSTVHRALATLRRAALVSQIGRGVYVLGDEFFRLAFRNYAARPDGALIKPTLEELARRFGETTHFAVLDGAEVVYREKVDPPQGAIRLTSVVGGRNPAQFTAVGKLLLAYAVSTLDELVALVGSEFTPRTPKSFRTAAELWPELERTRERGYGVDDQESEVGINCIALPVTLGDDIPPVGAISISALAFRQPLSSLLERVPEVRSVIEQFRLSSEAESSAS
ncbi:MAG TPA: IclR family transcriptional regulator [Pseudolysinimonas sp.]|nr:IclR family transcriptional regulator [Pseudolysinimonas sp.]